MSSSQDVANNINALPTSSSVSVLQYLLRDHEDTSCLTLHRTRCW